MINLLMQWKPWCWRMKQQLICFLIIIIFIISLIFSFPTTSFLYIELPSASQWWHSIRIISRTQFRKKCVTNRAKTNSTSFSWLILKYLNPRETKKAAKSGFIRLLISHEKLDVSQSLRRTNNTDTPLPNSSTRTSTAAAGRRQEKQPQTIVGESRLLFQAPFTHGRLTETKTLSSNKNNKTISDDTQRWAAWLTDSAEPPRLTQEVLSWEEGKPTWQQHDYSQQQNNRHNRLLGGGERWRFDSFDTRPSHRLDNLSVWYTAGLRQAVNELVELLGLELLLQTLF